jgi:hypothetical protein
MHVLKMPRKDYASTSQPLEISLEVVCLNGKSPGRIGVRTSLFI